MNASLVRQLSVSWASNNTNGSRVYGKTNFLERLACPGHVRFTTTPNGMGNAAIVKWVSAGL